MHRRLASGGRNVLMSIHQPRYSIFSLMDRLLILNKGNVVYSGPTKSAVEYFSEIGDICRLVCFIRLLFIGFVFWIWTVDVFSYKLVFLII